MGKIIITKIDRFDGGQSEDKRSKSSNKFSLTKNFDTMTYPHKIVPYRSTEADETKTFKVINFLYAPYTSAFTLYGLGQEVGTTKGMLYLYSIDVGLDNNWAGGTFLKSVNNVSNDNEVLFYYKDYVYIFTGSGRYLERVLITGTTNDFSVRNDYSAAGTVAQPVHHSADDIAYFFSDNIVSRQNGAAAFEAAVLTLPSDLKITSATPYGNYLAIACVTKGNADYRSVVYLWDRDAISWNFQINFGKGAIQHLANLDNKLIAVMDYQAKGGKGALARGKILIKQAIGDFGIQINELVMDTVGTSATLPKIRTLQDNKLYFVARPQLNGDTRNGIWVVDSIGRLTLDYVEKEAGQSGNYNGISKVRYRKASSSCRECKDNPNSFLERDKFS